MDRETVKSYLRPAVRLVHETRHPMMRRDRIDNEHLRLAVALSVPADANCIDVGASYGSVLANFVEFAPHGHHIAFEPIPRAANAIRRRFPAVEVHEAAAGDEPGVATFVHVLNDEGRSGLRRHHNYERSPQIEQLTVQVERLDDLASDYVPHVIKIDVEGAELQVLRGGILLISEHRPTIFFEHYKGGSEVYDTTPEDVWALLADAGLRVFDIDGDGPLAATDMRRRFDRMRLWQFVAHR